MIFDPMRTGVPGLRPDPSAGLPHRLPPYVFIYLKNQLMSSLSVHLFTID